MEQKQSQMNALRYTGTLNQLAGAKKYKLQEGRMAGVKAVDMWNGDGLNLTILCDRASDLYTLTFKGKSLTWLSDVGVSSPYFKHNGDYEWDNNFSGGMLVTCGLTTVGLPSIDDGKKYYLHGDISNIPSEEVHCTSCWENGKYIISYQARTRQARPYAENLVLTRSIKMAMGENRIIIRDTIENQGAEETPLMLLYHMNFGYPLLDENASLYLTKKECFPTSDWAKESLDQLWKVTPPDNQYRARAYNFTVQPDKDGYAWASVLNPSLPLGATIRFKADTLNRFNIWKCLQQRAYVVGMEPCNCRTWGRAKERENNGLVMLKPMERKEMEIELLIHANEKEIEEAEMRYRDERA